MMILMMIGLSPAGCFLYRAWEALLIGLIGAAIASAAGPLFDKMRIDDPVGASAVHGACGVWGKSHAVRSGSHFR